MFADRLFNIFQTKGHYITIQTLNTLKKFLQKLATVYSKACLLSQVWSNDGAIVVARTLLPLTALALRSPGEVDALAARVQTPVEGG